MNFEKYTEKSRQAVSLSQEIAIKKENQQIEGEHLHLALLLQEEGLIPKLLQFMGENLSIITNDVEKEVEKFPKVYGHDSSIFATRRFNKLLLDAEDISKKFKDEYVGVEHLYLSLLDERNTPPKRYSKVLTSTEKDFLKPLQK